MESHRALYSAIVLGDNADDTQLFSLCHMSLLKDINVQIACWFLLVSEGDTVSCQIPYSGWHYLGIQYYWVELFLSFNCT